MPALSLSKGCRVTSIQRFLGHNELGMTMVYARAHDQTVADDYFAAMARIEQRLDIGPSPKQESSIKVVKEQGRNQLLVFVEQLAQAELSLSERLNITEQLRELFGAVQEHAPPEEAGGLVGCEAL